MVDPASGGGFEGCGLLQFQFLELDGPCGLLVERIGFLLFVFRRLFLFVGVPSLVGLFALCFQVLVGEGWRVAAVLVAMFGLAGGGVLVCSSSCSETG
jgi:hypothetical protein